MSASAHPVRPAPGRTPVLLVEGSYRVVDGDSGRTRTEKLELAVEVFREPEPREPKEPAGPRGGKRGGEKGGTLARKKSTCWQRRRGEGEGGAALRGSRRPGRFQVAAQTQRSPPSAVKRSPQRTGPRATPSWTSSSP